MIRQMAAHFVAAEIKQFPFGQLDEAVRLARAGQEGG